jgi:hypothetical protein
MHYKNPLFGNAFAIKKNFCIRKNFLDKNSQGFILPQLDRSGACYLAIVKTIKKNPPKSQNPSPQAHIDEYPNPFIRETHTRLCDDFDRRRFDALRIHCPSCGKCELEFDRNFHTRR